MTITNDIIIFDPADFDGLSDLAKKALPPYSGTTPFEETFANQLNEHIRIAKSLLKQTTVTADPKLESLLGGLAGADKAKLDEVEPLLDQVRAALGVSIDSPIK